MAKTSYKENLTIAVDFVYDINTKTYVSFKEEPVTKGSFCSFTGITKEELLYGSSLVIFTRRLHVVDLIEKPITTTIHQKGE